MRLTLKILLLIPCFANAETVWVLGSFAEPGNAAAEQRRLAETLTLPVVTAPAANSTRVVVPTRLVSREALNEMGIEAWAVNMSVDAAALPTSMNVLDTVADEAHAADTDLAEAVAPVADAVGPGEPVIAVDSPQVISGAPAQSFDAAPGAVSEQSAPDAAMIERERSRLELLCGNVSREQEKRICRAWRVGGDLDVIAEKYQ